METYINSSALLTHKKTFRDFIPIKILVFISAIGGLQTLLTLQTVFSQPVTQEWVRNYPGPSNDLIGPFLAVDKNGNSYIAGTHVINDSINILCVKYNTQGVQQWATLYKYPGEGYFAPTGLAIDSSGNAYVISLFGQTYLVPLNGLIVKFNSINGSAVWARRYIGQTGVSAFRDIKIDRLNNIYIAGASDLSHLVVRYNTNGDSIWVRKYSPQSCGEVALACTIDDSLNIIFTGRRRRYYPPYAYYDSLLAAKYSPSGVLRWESVYANNYLGSDGGTKITADQNGSLYIGGVTNVSSDVVYLTLKYDRNGVRQWVKIYDAPGSGDNTISGIAVDRIGNALFVTGYSVINNVGSAATIKYNASTGDSIWVRRGYGVPGSSSAWDLTLDSSGNVYITGSSLGVSNSDVSTLKYSPQGNQIWFATYNGPYNGGDGARTMEIDKQNNVYVLGYSESGYQLSDYTLIKYSQFSGIQPIGNEIPNLFKLEQNFPNPFNPKSSIKFQISKLSEVKLTVFDVLGREIAVLVNQQLTPGTYEVDFDGSKYSSGVYFYRLTAGDYTETRKMVLLK
jgi:hypothetical protein